MKTRMKPMGLHNTFEHMIAAPKKQACCYVNGALLNLDDDTLNCTSFSHDKIKQQGTAVLHTCQSHPDLAHNF
jgi:hypothetical protein